MSYIGNSGSVLIFGKNAYDDIVPDGVSDTFNLSLEVPGGNESAITVLRKKYVVRSVIQSCETISFNGTTEQIVIPANIMGLFSEILVSDSLIITGATNPANNGTFEITSITSDGSDLKLTLDTNLVTESAGASINISFGHINPWEVLAPEKDFTVGGIGIYRNKQISFSEIPSESDEIYVVHAGESTLQYTPADKSVQPEHLSDNLRNFVCDRFTANGSQTVFALSQSAVNTKSLLVYVDGVMKDGDDESFSGLWNFTDSNNNSITFDTAPTNGAKIKILHLGFSTVSRRASLSPSQVGAVADNSITTNKLASNAVTTAKLDTASVTNAKLASDSVTSEKILLENNTALRGKKADTTPVDIIKIQSDNDVEINSDANILLRTNSADRLLIADAKVEPVTTNQLDLGSSSKKFKDLHLQGNANVTGNVNSANITTLTNLLGGVDVVALQTLVNTLADSLIPIGTITISARATQPVGFWLDCHGQELSRTTYATLFSVIGITFGAGNGTTTFNVPDFRGRFPLGKSVSGTGNTLGQTGGSLDHTHTISNHTHTLTHTHGVPAHYHAIQASSTLNILSSGGHTHTIAHGHTASAGTGYATVSIAYGGGHGHSITDPGHSHGIIARGVFSSARWAQMGDGLNIRSGQTLNDDTSRTLNLPVQGSGTGIGVNFGGEHGHTASDSGHGHTITVNSHSGDSGSSSHTHPANSFSGTIGHVTGGTNGDSTFNTISQSTDTTSSSGAGSTSSSNPAYLAVNFIIRAS